MAAALKKNIERLEKNTMYIHSLEKLLIDQLKEGNVVFIRNGTVTLPGLLSPSFPNQSGETLLHRLDLKKICISTGAACNGSDDEISHVLQAIGLDEDAALGTIRISLGKNNTENDAVCIAKAIRAIIGRN